MLRSEIEAAKIVEVWNITDPFLRNQAYKHLLHGLKLQYGEYPRLPRKLKKRMKLASLKRDRQKEMLKAVKELTHG